MRAKSPGCQIPAHDLGGDRPGRTLWLFVASTLLKLSLVGTRLRVLFSRAARRMGMGETAFLVPLAVIVGAVTAAAAVGFHELILLIRAAIYGRAGPDYLYGPGLWVLVAAPALGGLAVGIISRKLAGEKEGHGVVDVIESVARTRGFVRPIVAIEKIFTSAITIGTGGSAGAEGPIVQIGAAVSSGAGALFRIARHQMPTLVGCGCAAGISAIFNAPIGGLLFALEVILLDFSIRTLTPIIVASVVANVTMRALVPAVGQWLHGGGESAYITVFATPQLYFGEETLLNWGEMGNFVLLGLLCGGLGVAFIKAMQLGDGAFRRIVTGSAWIKALRPAVGGLLLGVTAVIVVLATGDMFGGRSGPFSFGVYASPAFYGDGYPVIEQLLQASFYRSFESGTLIWLLLGLCALKALATVLTLTSGGSGGVIAPSLFLGATAGGALGVVLRTTGWFTEIRPEAYALIGMAAVLAAVVHAPLASILILFEITGEDKVLLPAMLGVIVALGIARLFNRDSLYTAALRRRGVVLGAGGDAGPLSRLTVEQIGLEPASVAGADEPITAIVDRLGPPPGRDLAVLGPDGAYVGLLRGPDGLSAAQSGVDAKVGQVMRTEVPVLLHTDELGRAFELFALHGVAQLPVALADPDGRAGTTVIGMISRAAVMRHVGGSGS